MKNVCLYCWLLFAVTMGSYGQNQKILQNNNWVFGTRNSLRFITAPATNPNSLLVRSPGTMPAAIATVTTGSVNTFAPEGCASVSDRLGNLLFYTNGVQVYDRNNNLITAGLLGNVSSAQNVIIIPRPNFNKRFYIVTSYGRTLEPNTATTRANRGIYFSEIDLEQPISSMMVSLNTPLQDMNGVPIDGSPNANNQNNSEALTSAMHSNGTDYWLVVHVRSNEPNTSPITAYENIYSYQVTTDGINLQANARTAITSYSVLGDGVCMKISPDNLKIAITTFSNGLYYGGFDNSNGVVTINNRIYRTGIFRTFGVEFSQNSNVLYYSGIWDSETITDPPTPRENFLTRLNLANNTAVTNTTQFGFWGIQRGLDDRIYLCDRSTSITDQLSVINFPNNVVNDPIITGTLTMNQDVDNCLPQLVWKQPCEMTLTDDEDIPTTYLVEEQRKNWIECTNTIQTGAIGIYHAGNFIEMLPDDGANLGFEADLGSEFVAYIAECDAAFVYRNSDSTTNAVLEKESIHKDKLQIFPNPSNTFITIALNSNKLNHIAINSIDGKLILDKNVNDHSQQIDVSGFTNGLYLITVQTDDGRSINSKFIKN